jgi:DNA-binding NtrC family response regulator
MALTLNILLVEDSPEDAELLVAELRRGGFEPQWKRVETEADYRAGLEDAPDLIIADYTLPQFGGLRAVDLLQERGLDIPFILVSGTVGEEKAVEAMKHGATDYLLKDRIERLGNAVESALEQKRLRDERGRMQKQLALHAAASENAANAIVITDRAGTILWVNPAFTTVTGYAV